MGKKIRAAAAVADGIHGLDRITRRTSVSKLTLARWVQEPEVAAYVRARNELFDLWLRQRTQRLMLHALNALKRMLSSPNAPWPAQAWAITRVLQLNGYDIADGADRRYSTALRDDIPPRLPRRRRQGISRHRVDARTHAPPIQRLPG